VGFFEDEEEEILIEFPGILIVFVSVVNRVLLCFGRRAVVCYSSASFAI
jgi:hypothetical protein